MAAARKSPGTPYQIAKRFGLIGAFASGRKDSAANRKRYLKRLLRAKNFR